VSGKIHNNNWEDFITFHEPQPKPKKGQTQEENETEFEEQLEFKGFDWDTTSEITFQKGYYVSSASALDGTTTTMTLAPEVFDHFPEGEEWPHEKLRQKYPALNDIWEKYCMVKHMCEQREKEERE